MSEIERERWVQRWAEGDYHPREKPSELVMAWAPRIPKGKALDLACGNGRNALFLASQGFTVDAIDIAAPALQLASNAARERGLIINPVEADLEEYHLPLLAYELVITCFFLSRNLIPQVKDALKPSGYVVYEHHFLTEHDVAGPRDQHFRLLPNELLQLFSDFRVRFFTEGLEREGDRIIAVQRLVAQKPPASHEQVPLE